MTLPWWVGQVGEIDGGLYFNVIVLRLSLLFSGCHCCDNFPIQIWFMCPKFGHIKQSKLACHIKQISNWPGRAEGKFPSLLLISAWQCAYLSGLALGSNSREAFLKWCKPRVKKYLWKLIQPKVNLRSKSLKDWDKACSRMSTIYWAVPVDSGHTLSQWLVQEKCVLTLHRSKRS